jgi:hypothetical protein
VAGLSARASDVSGSFSNLDLVALSPLVARTSGRPDISIGLIDGPVALDHPDLAAENIGEVPGKLPAACADASDAACTHGTFIAGILLARRMFPWLPRSAPDAVFWFARSSRRRPPMASRCRAHPPQTSPTPLSTSSMPGPGSSI